VQTSETLLDIAATVSSSMAWYQYETFQTSSQARGPGVGLGQAFVPPSTVGFAPVMYEASGPRAAISDSFELDTITGAESSVELAAPIAHQQLHTRLPPCAQCPFERTPQFVRHDVEVRY
jgi:hypothetical protein